MSLLSVAAYSFTGTLIIPKLTVPFQIDRGIRVCAPLGSVARGDPTKITDQ